MLNQQKSTASGTAGVLANNFSVTLHSNKKPVRQRIKERLFSSDEIISLTQIKCTDEQNALETITHIIGHSECQSVM